MSEDREIAATEFTDAQRREIRRMIGDALAADETQFSDAKRLEISRIYAAHRRAMAEEIREMVSKLLDEQAERIKTEFERVVAERARPLDPPVTPKPRVN